jgi:hypothetical protein
MKTVLFVTDHLPPDPKALDYALVLCRRMAARLEVLHILQSSASAGSDGRLGRPGTRTTGLRAKPVRGMQASADPGVPDAEKILRSTAFDQLKRLLPDHPHTRVDYRCEISDEATGAIIERYVRSHRDIVLTVFDPHSDRYPADIRRKTRRPARAGAMPRLAIPLVLVKKPQ